MSNVDRYGNTSAASIPIALCEAIAQDRVKAGDYLAFVGFGGGLTWAAMVVQWVDTRKAENIRVLAPQRRQVSYFLASVRANIRKATRPISAKQHVPSANSPGASDPVVVECYDYATRSTNWINDYKRAPTVALVSYFDKSP